MGNDFTNQKYALSETERIELRNFFLTKFILNLYF